MTPEELGAVVAEGEKANVEFKSTTGRRSDGAKAVCAMLNGGGGFVLFGVTDDGEIRGQDVTSGSLEDVANELRRITETPERTVQDNLQMLRNLGLVELKGWARGARWMLRGEHD